MKKLRGIFTCILLGAMLLSMTACTSAPKEKEYPEHYEQYSALLGKTRQEVLTQLGLTENDLPPGAKGLYAIPVKAQYNGLSFDVTLEFDEVNDRLWGFSYTTHWQDRWEEAIGGVEALAKKLTEDFGEARADIDSKRFADMSKEELTSAFADKDKQVGTDYWQVEKRDDAATWDYVALIREQMSPGRTIADHLNLTLQMQVNADEAAASALALLSFRLELEYT